MTTILLVEDNPMNRDMLSRRLQKKGYEVLVAVDGEQALGMTCDLKPDLVILDISLPVMDGYEVVQRLKALPECGAIPVLGLSAHAMSGDREKAITAGCDEYDMKPVEMPRLLGKIEDLLNQKGAQGD